jgi:hypothetical protein
VEGSFDNWSNRHTLQRSGRDFTIVKLLPPGVYQVRRLGGKAAGGGQGRGRVAAAAAPHRLARRAAGPAPSSATRPCTHPPTPAPLPAPQYKFIVDGEWRYDPNQPAMYDEIGNVNNVMEVQEYVPENLDGVQGFDPPPSPPSSYSNPHPVAEDYSKEPPVLPPHLQLTLLNVPPAMDSQAALPRPQHVILNHMYVQRGHNVNALVVSGPARRPAAAPEARWSGRSASRLRPGLELLAAGR